MESARRGPSEHAHLRMAPAPAALSGSKSAGFLKRGFHTRDPFTLEYRAGSTLQTRPPHPRVLHRATYFFTSLLKTSNRDRLRGNLNRDESQAVFARHGPPPPNSVSVETLPITDRNAASGAYRVRCIGQVVVALHEGCDNRFIPSSIADSAHLLLRPAYSATGMRRCSAVCPTHRKGRTR